MSSPDAPGEAPGGGQPGRVLAGRYELGQLLGSGGMAEVYAAVDRRLGRTVAVKVLRPDLARDDSVRSRFRREAQSAASLNHPAVVAVHDTGDDTTEPFIVMEYVPGYTLRDVMQRGQPMPVDQALEITAGVLTALEFAHRAGIVHRDIKPGNVMLTPDGAVKVMDFGIARAVSDDLTITQTVVGTPAYLSPEHAEGRPVDVRSDLYSTGCVLFELLTGRPPFVAESAYVVAVQHIQEAPPVLSSLNPALPPALDQIVAKALVKDRDFRYQTAAEFRADLMAARAGQASDAALPRSGDAREEPTDPIVLDTTARMPSAVPSASAVPPVGGPEPATANAPPTPPVPPVEPASVPTNQPVPAPTNQPPSARPVPASQSQPTPSSSGAAPTVVPGAAPPPPTVVPAAVATHPGGYAPDGQSAPAPGPAKRRRWPWAAAAAVLLVVGGAVFVLVQGGDGGGTGPTPGADRTSEPIIEEAFNTATMDPPSPADLQSSVKELSTVGTVEVLDTHGTVKVLDPVGTVKLWVEPETKDGMTVVPLSTDVLFDFGSAVISEGGDAAIWEAVEPVPRGASIDVTGYTDSQGGDDFNISLSQRRADAVAAVIGDKRRDLVVSSVGRGSADEVASNDTPEGRAKNRRVEIRYAS